MKNSIAERVRDFLKLYPPFNLLSTDKLFDIAKEVVIIYLEKGDVLFKEGTRCDNHFYIIREGAVSLTILKTIFKKWYLLVIPVIFLEYDP